MITESEIYWITRLDGIKSSCEVVAVLLALFCSILAGMLIIAIIDEGNEQIRKRCKIALLAMLPLWLLGPGLGISSVFVPTTKEMCAIKILPVIAKDEDVQALPKEFVGLARSWMEELKPEKQDK